MITFNSICTKDDLKILKKYSLSVKLRKDKIADIIECLLEIDTRKLDNSIKNSINRDLDYLDAVKINNDIDIMLKTRVDNCIISVSPLSIFAIRLLEPTRVISFNIGDILKALAFRHLHYEFGYKVTDIEECLKDTKMVVRNEPSSLMDLVNKNIDSFKLLRDFKISDLSYLSGDKSYIYDHFSNKVKVKDNYNPLIQSTFLNASLFSSIELSKEMLELGIQFKPLGHLGTDIFFLLGKEEDASKLKDISLTVEIFNRKFKFNLVVTLGGNIRNVD